MREAFKHSRVAGTLAVAVLMSGTTGVMAQTGLRAAAEMRAREQARQQAQLAASAAATGSTETRPLDADEVELPANPRQWRNSPPLSLEALEGKGVVFYFFEEECPTCADRWPALNAMAAKHQGEPVLFVAVNSGSDPRVLNRYLQSNRVGWRVIHDVDRSLENAMGVPTLSLQSSVFAVRYLNGKGDLATGMGTDFEGTVKQALEGAAWRVAPQGIPRELMRAWESIEFADFASAARAVNKAADAKEGPVKQAAIRLREAVEAEVTEAAKKAQEALRDDENWAAYQKLNLITKQFGDYEDLPLVERAESKRDELAKDPAIAKEIEAAELLEKAIDTASRGTPAAMRRGKGLLERLIEKHAGTEAAQRAEKLLAATAQ